MMLTGGVIPVFMEWLVAQRYISGETMSMLNICYGLGVFVPTVAIAVRRLHDVGKSGLFLVLYIPFFILLASMGMEIDVNPLFAAACIVPAVWPFLLFLRDSQPGTNKYGPNPKGVEAKSK